MREVMMQNIFAYNKYITEDCLEPMDEWMLLGLTHPIERKIYRKELELRDKRLGLQGAIKI